MFETDTDDREKTVTYRETVAEMIGFFPVYVADVVAEYRLYLRDLRNRRGKYGEFENREEAVRYNVRTIRLAGGLLFAFGFAVLGLLASLDPGRPIPTLLDAIWAVPLVLGFLLIGSVYKVRPEDV